MNQPTHPDLPLVYVAMELAIDRAERVNNIVRFYLSASRNLLCWPESSPNHAKWKESTEYWWKILQLNTITSGDVDATFQTEKDEYAEHMKKVFGQVGAQP